MTTTPTVLFVCIHNAGRSQMAAGYITALSHGAVEVRSGGSEPGNEINPMAIQAMREEGIDISQGVPQLMTTGVTPPRTSAPKTGKTNGGINVRMATSATGSLMV